jgi:hypothetical protein
MYSLISDSFVHKINVFFFSLIFVFLPRRKYVANGNLILLSGSLHSIWRVILCLHHLIDSAINWLID